jgi:hypothetical protein
LRRQRALLVLAALLAGLLAGPVTLRGDEAKPESERLRKALERSLLFPGLGQLYEKRYVKAALFASAEALCIVEVIIHARRGNDAYRQYRDAATPEAAVAWRGETERCDRRRNTALLAAAGVWVLNMADMLVFAKKKYGRGKSVAFHPYYYHESQAYGAGITCRF